MNYSRAAKSELFSTSNHKPGSNKPRQKQKGPSDTTAAVHANTDIAANSSTTFVENTAGEVDEIPAKQAAMLSGQSGQPALSANDRKHAATELPLQVTAETAQPGDESSLALWPNWPAARIDRQGVIHTNNAKVLQTLEPVMLQRAGKPAQLTDSANRRLWAMVDQDQSQEQWKVLDPVFWPFVGIVGWSSQSRDALQLAAWEPAQTPWQIDDSWRQILTATAAVKAKRKQRVA